MSHRIRVIDSHTGGEPTRVVIGGFPDLGGGSVADRARRFEAEFDHYRRAIVNEPRGSDVIVGALLCEPSDPGCVAGVIYFDNVTYLGMCGHGTIGFVTTLAHLNRLGPGDHRIETPVGIVTAKLHDDGRVTVRNIPSYRFARDVSVELAQGARVVGDVAWGGNWFFLVKDHNLEINLANVDELTDFTWRIRRALSRQGVVGRDGHEVDHVILFSEPGVAGLDSRNFVMCPGKAYDRSPCGTGTSAKLACLAADGTLKPGDIWRQESVVGSVFEGTFELAGESIIPSITGSAWISSEATLILDENDPFCWGIPG